MACLFRLNCKYVVPEEVEAVMSVRFDNRDVCTVEQSDEESTMIHVEPNGQTMTLHLRSGPSGINGEEVFDRRQWLLLNPRFKSENPPE